MAERRSIKSFSNLRLSVEVEPSIFLQGLKP